MSAAKKAGIDSSQLRRYEDGLAPLRYDDAKRLCEALDIGMPWLIGDVEKHLSAPILDDSEFTQELSDRALFSDVYAKFLRSRYEDFQSEFPSAVTFGVGMRFSAPTPEALEQMAKDFADEVGDVVRREGSELVVTKSFTGIFAPVSPKPRKKKAPASLDPLDYRLASPKEVADFQKTKRQPR